MVVMVVTVGGYLVTAGGVITAVSQATTNQDDLQNDIEQFPKGVIDDGNQ